MIDNYIMNISYGYNQVGSHNLVKYHMILYTNSILKSDILWTANSQKVIW